jgi:hypothetical protein
MLLRGKKLGILISAGPDHPNFTHGLKLAESAMARGVAVYCYCIDEAVLGVSDGRLQHLKGQGMRLFACAYAAQRRHIPLSDDAVFAGLTIVNDLIEGTDRFVSFN